MTKKLRQNCVCKNCGNEAEMEITCSLNDYEDAVEKKEKHDHADQKEDSKVKGTGVCTTCGNEADMWVDI